MPHETSPPPSRAELADTLARDVRRSPGRHAHRLLATFRVAGAGPAAPADPVPLEDLRLDVLGYRGRVAALASLRAEADLPGTGRIRFRRASPARVVDARLARRNAGAARMALALHRGGDDAPAWAWGEGPGPPCFFFGYRRPCPLGAARTACSPAWITSAAAGRATRRAPCSAAEAC